MTDNDIYGQASERLRNRNNGMLPQAGDTPGTYQGRADAFRRKRQEEEQYLAEKAAKAATDAAEQASKAERERASAIKSVASEESKNAKTYIEDTYPAAKAESQARRDAIDSQIKKDESAAAGWFGTGVFADQEAAKRIPQQQAALKAADAEIEAYDKGAAELEAQTRKLAAKADAIKDIEYAKDKATVAGDEAEKDRTINATLQKRLRPDVPKDYQDSYAEEMERQGYKLTQPAQPATPVGQPALDAPQAGPVAPQAPGKPKATEQSVAANLEADVLAGRKAIRSRAIQSTLKPGQWASMKPAEKRAYIQEFQAKKEADLAAYDEAQAALSPDRKAIIDNARGMGPVTDVAAEAVAETGKRAKAAYVAFGQGGASLLPSAASFTSTLLKPVAPESAETIQQFSEGFRAYYDERIPEDMKDAFSTKLANTLGQIAGFILPGGAISKAAQATMGAAKAASATKKAYMLMGMMMNGGNSYYEAKKNGASEPAAWGKFLLDSGLGTIEGLVGPEALLLSNANRLTRGAISRIFTAQVASAGGEAIEEIIQNGASDVYDKFFMPENAQKSWTQIGADTADAATQAFVGSLIFTTAATPIVRGKAKAIAAQQQTYLDTQEEGTRHMTSEAVYREAASELNKKNDKITAAQVRLTEIDGLITPTTPDQDSTTTNEKGEMVKTPGRKTLLAEKAALETQLAEEAITPEAVQVASDMTDGTTGKFAANEAEITRLQSEIAAAKPTKESFFKPTDWERIADLQGQLSGKIKNRAKLFQGDQDSGTVEKFRQTLAVAKEIAKFPDAQADTNGNGVPRGNSQREIAKAIYTLATTGRLTPGAEHLIGANGKRIFTKPNKEGHIFIANPDTESAIKATPLLNTHYETYKANPSAVLPQQETGPVQDQQAPEGSVGGQTNRPGNRPVQTRAASPGTYRVGAKSLTTGEFAPGITAEVTANSEAEAIQKVSTGEVQMPAAPGNHGWAVQEVVQEPQEAQYADPEPEEAPEQPAAKVEKRHQELADKAGREAVAYHSAELAALDAKIANAKPEELENLQKIRKLMVEDAPLAGERIAATLKAVDVALRMFGKAFKGGIKIVDASAESGGMVYAPGTDTLIIYTKDVLKSSSPDRLTLVGMEEWIHKTIEAKGLDVAGLWKSLSKEAQDATIATYPAMALMNDSQRGHEYIRINLQKHIRINAKTGLMYWDNLATGETSEEKANRGLLVKMREFLKAILDSWNALIKDGADTEGAKVALDAVATIKANIQTINGYLTEAETDKTQEKQPAPEVKQEAPTPEAQPAAEQSTPEPQEPELAPPPPRGDADKLERKLSEKAFQSVNVPANRLAAYLNGTDEAQPPRTKPLSDKDVLALYEYYYAKGDEARVAIINDEIARRDQEEAMAEFQEEEQAKKYELLEAVAIEGGFPKVSAQHQSQLDRMQETGDKEHKGRIKGVFRDNARDIDTLRGNLQDYGFTFETESDLLDAMEQRLATGKPVMGSESVNDPFIFSQAASAKEVLADLEKTRLIPSKVAVKALGGTMPEYLNGVIDFIMNQRRKLVDGNLSVRDVAKAYIITQGSIGSDARHQKTVNDNLAKHGIQPVPDIMFDRNAAGDPVLRPEHLTSWWLMTPTGQRALDSIESGQINEAAFDELTKARSIYGKDNFRLNSVTGLLKRKTGTFEQGAAPQDGGFNLANVTELTAAINATRGDTAQILRVATKAKGIGEAKKGFILHLLGVGNAPTTDAVEINFWLTGKGDIRNVQSKAAQRVRALTERLGDSRVSAEVYRRISSRIKDLRNIVSEANPMPDEVAGHVIHHWIWDRAKGIETDHRQMYNTMALASQSTTQAAKTIKAELAKILPHTKATPTRGGIWIAASDKEVNGTPETTAGSDDYTGVSVTVSSEGGKVSANVSDINSGKRRSGMGRKMLEAISKAGIPIYHGTDWSGGFWMHIKKNYPELLNRPELRGELGEAKWGVKKVEGGYQITNTETGKSDVDTSIYETEAEAMEAAVNYNQGFNGARGRIFTPDMMPALMSQAPGRSYESMEFTPPFKTPRGEILSYSWVNDGRRSDWNQAKTNPLTGREIVHHFKIRTPKGDVSTVSLETAMGMLSSDQRNRINKRIKAEMQRRQDAANGQGFLFSQSASPFYSRMENAINAKIKGKFASPEQLKAIVNNPQEVKAEEVKWSGIVPKIDQLAKDNGGKVPMDELRQWMATEGMVQFREVVSQDYEDFRKSLRVQPNADGANVVDANGEVVGRFSNDKMAGDAIRKGVIKNPRTPTYGQYALPGGTNYREIVLAMPVEPVLRTYYRIMDKDGMMWLRSKFNTPQAAIDEINAMTGRTPDEEGVTVAEFTEETENPAKGYTSNHFTYIPGYVAHIRLNDRTDAEGRPGTFIEEEQADGHQQAREIGYADELPEGWEIKEVKDGPVRYGATEYLALYNPKGTEVRVSPLRDRERLIATARTTESGKTQIPPTPHRKDWPIALFKRALRDAVAAGHEWIGWTSGKTQADRYDLSKQVDSINAKPDSDGNWTVRVLDKNGNAVAPLKLTTDELPNYIGKDLAQKIISDKGGEYSGLDLKVGGEGMKGFYDQILPKEVQAYIKQWKAEDGSRPQVERGVIPTGKNTEIRDAQGKRYATLRNQQPSTVDLTAYPEGFSAVPEDSTTIWRVNITPAMRESVATRGQALFSQSATPRQKNPAPDDIKAAHRNFVANNDDVFDLESALPFIGTTDEESAAITAFSRGAFTEINAEPESPVTKAVLRLIDRIPAAKGVQAIHRVLGFKTEKDANDYVKGLGGFSSNQKQRNPVTSWTQDDPRGEEANGINNIGIDVASQFGNHRVILTIERPTTAKDVSFIYGERSDGTGLEYLLPQGTVTRIVGAQKTSKGWQVTMRQTNNSPEWVENLFSQSASPDQKAEAAGQLLIDFAPLVTKQISLPADEPRAIVPLTPEQSQLVADNLGLAYMVANRAAARGWDREEATQEASLGLAKAARAFDPARGIKFSTYAVPIIKNQLTDTGRKLSRAKARDGGSLNETLTGEKGDTTTKQDMLAGDINQAQPDEDGLATFRRLASTLPANLREMMEEYGSGQTYEAIAQKRQVSRQAIQQAIQKGTRRLAERLREAGITSSRDIFPDTSPDTPTITRSAKKESTGVEDDEIKDTMDPREPDAQVDASPDILSSQGATPLTETKFEREYVQHIDIRSRGKGAEEQRAKIMRDGFKKGANVNALPVTRGREPNNVIERNYQPKAGDLILLAPQGAWKDAPNGLEIRDGWKPKPHEAIIIKTDNPDMYAEYVSAMQDAREPDAMTEQGDVINSQAATRTYTPDQYPESLAKSIASTRTNQIINHPRFMDAKKGGDTEAALEIVDALLKRPAIDAIKATLDPSRPVVIVPIQAREGASMNRIPKAYARRLAEYLGGTVNEDIVKSTGAANTGASGDARLSNDQGFDGAIPAGTQVVVADDTFTSGGTIVALIDHLKTNGADIKAATTLAYGRYSNWLKPPAGLTDKVLAKAGMTSVDFKRELGYPITNLTGSELQGYILNGAKGQAGILRRFPASGSQGSGPRTGPTLQSQAGSASFETVTEDQARAELGRAQPLSAMVKTRLGWSEIGDLKRGDEIEDPDGGWQFVKAVYPQGSLPVSRIELESGKSTEASRDHLWRYKDRESDQDNMVTTTATLLEGFRLPVVK